MSGRGSNGDLLRVACVGLGWVTTNRHIPWLRRHPRVRLVGVVDRRADRIAAAARRYGVGRAAVATGPDDVPWLDEVNAVTIGTPPWTHADLTRAFLGAGKHVLQEKPFAMSAAEADDLAQAAGRASRTLAVVHNFQFARSVTRLRRLVADGSLGEIRGIWGVQLSNPDRRLPAWYEELPLGLFYDESPHLLYLVRCLSPSEPIRDHARVVPSSAGRATPHQVDLAMHAGDVRIRVSLDFEAPVSEWHVAVMGSRRMAVADVFRDVLVVVDNDGLHRGRDILRTTWSALSGHLLGVAASGALLTRGRLSYGNDEVIRRFVDACLDGAEPAGIAPADGRWVTGVQEWVVEVAGADREDPAREQLLPS
jgi:scyllo-inositol 2-dehydrogenase (NADP+)